MQAELHDLASQIKLCKSKVFGDEDEYLYIFFLGTAESARGRGLCSELVKHYQEKLPLYLEAGTAYCQNLYTMLGFDTVGEFVIGQGKAGSNGALTEGGPGFKMWGMLWRPK